jgi:hypothetical protein
MNWIHLITNAIWVYCVLLGVAFFITYHSHARQRARRVKKCGNGNGGRIDRRNLLFAQRDDRTDSDRAHRGD